jgi:hypothetical protein
MAGRPRKHPEHDGTPAARQRASRAARRAEGLVLVQLMLPAEAVAALDAAAEAAGLTRAEWVARTVAPAR